MNVYDVATLARSGETRRSIFGPTETLVRQQDVLGRPAGLTLGNDYAEGIEGHVSPFFN